MIEDKRAPTGAQWLLVTPGYSATAKADRRDRFVTSTARTMQFR
jgi:hypothetical protein